MEIQPECDVCATVGTNYATMMLHLGCLQQCVRRGIRWNHTTVWEAFVRNPEGGYMPCVRWAVENGYVAGDMEIRKAVEAGAFDVLGCVLPRQGKTLYSELSTAMSPLAPDYEKIDVLMKYFEPSRDLIGYLDACFVNSPPEDILERKNICSVLIRGENFLQGYDYATEQTQKIKEFFEKVADILATNVPESVAHSVLKYYF